MNLFTINAGLWHPGTQDEMMVSRCLAALEIHGVRVKRIGLVRKRGEEPSLVLDGNTVLDFDFISTAIYKACHQLGQDCMAVWWAPDPTAAQSCAAGHLIGPKTADWLPFNPAYFHFL